MKIDYNLVQILKCGVASWHNYNKDIKMKGTIVYLDSKNEISFFLIMSYERVISITGREFRNLGSLKKYKLRDNYIVLGNPKLIVCDTIVMNFETTRIIEVEHRFVNPRYLGFINLMPLVKLYCHR